MIISKQLDNPGKEQTKGWTFAEKILGARAGTIVFRAPGLVLSHDNSASIESTNGWGNGWRLNRRK